MTNRYGEKENCVFRSGGDIPWYSFFKLFAVKYALLPPLHHLMVFFVCMWNSWSTFLREKFSKMNYSPFSRKTRQAREGKWSRSTDKLVAHQSVQLTFIFCHFLPSLSLTQWNYFDNDSFHGKRKIYIYEIIKSWFAIKSERRSHKCDVTLNHTGPTSVNERQK